MGNVEWEVEEGAKKTQKEENINKNNSIWYVEFGIENAIEVGS